MAKKMKGGETGVSQKVPMEQFNPKGSKESGSHNDTAQPSGVGQESAGSYGLLEMEHGMEAHNEKHKGKHPIPMHESGHFHGGHSGGHTPHDTEKY